MLLLVVAVLLAVLLAVVIELNVVLFKNRLYLFVYFFNMFIVLIHNTNH